VQHEKESSWCAFLEEIEGETRAKGSGKGSRKRDLRLLRSAGGTFAGSRENEGVKRGGLLGV